MFLSSEANLDDIILRRGTLATSSISFESEITVFDGTSSTDHYQKPSISIDGNNKLWVAGVKDTGNELLDHLQAFTARSVNAANGNLSTFETATAVGRKSSLLKDIVIMPQTGSEMYLLMNTDAPNVVGFHFNGTSWSSANTGGDFGWFSFPGGLNSIVYALAVSGSDIYVGGFFTSLGAGVSGSHYFSKYGLAVAVDSDASTEISSLTDTSGDVHMIYTNTDDDIIYRHYDDSGSSWQTSVMLRSTGGVTSPSLAINPTTGDLYAFWIESNDIVYKKGVAPYNSSDWDTNPTTMYGVGNNSFVTTPLPVSEEQLLASWTNGLLIPVNVYTDSISITPEMDLLGNATSIVDGDATPSLTDHTDFGSISSALGTVTRIFTIENTGDFNLSLSGNPRVVIGGTHASDFTVSVHPATPVTVGDSTTFHVIFDPNAVGLRTATVSIDNSDADENPYNFAIQGTGLLDTDGDGDPDVTDPDDDNDGVSDLQEGVDGTDPLDAGSFLQVLGTNLCSDWNGFLDMFNILEHVNLSVATRGFTTTIYNINGVGQSSQNGSVLSGAQTDVLVHDMSGFIDNSYGRVCSAHDGTDGDMDGRIAYYRPNSTGYDFAFTLPFNNALKGRQYVLFNTYQPSLDPADANNFVANWVQVTNLEGSAQTGTIYYYSQAGTVLATDTQTLPAGARRDFSGHQFGLTLVGMIEWRPDNTNALFQMRSTRYFYDNPTLADSFDAAMSLDGIRGSGQALIVPIDTRNSTAVLEVGNATSSSQAIVVQFYSGAGALLGTQNLNLPAYGSAHLVADGVIVNSLGSAKIDGATSQGVVAAAMQYGRTASLGINYVYATPAKQALGLGLKGSYNTFLGQSCELEIVNASSSATTATVGMKRYDGTTVLSGHVINLAANGTAGYNACANDVNDIYGVVTVDAATNNTLTAHIVRQRSANDYRFSTPVRQ
ncbi:choice-of-anchor D domain-containing protein [bacterium]|nr:choice-of-anchor D domain-containing protein [bacterium]